MDIRTLLHNARTHARGALGRELLRGGAGSGIMRIAEVALGVASAILLARQLGVSGLGMYSVAIATVTVAALPIEFGFPALVLRETARASAKGDWAAVRAVLRFSTYSIILIALVLGIAAAAIGPWLIDRFASELITTFAAAVPIPLLTALSNVRAAALRGLRKPLLGTAPESLVRPGAFILFLSATVLLAPGWLTPARAAALASTAAALGFLFAAVSLARHNQLGARSRLAKAPLRAWLAAALDLGLQQGLRVAQGQILLLIAGAFGSVDTVGLLRIAQRGASVASFGYTTVVVLIAPYLARLDAEGDRVRLQRLITISARTTTVATVIPFAIFMIAGRPLLSLLFGPKFADAQPALVIISLAFVLIGILGPAQILMMMLNRERVTVAALAAALMIATVLATALAGQFGAIGVATAEAAGLVVAELILWYAARRMLRLRTSIFGY